MAYCKHVKNGYIVGVGMSHNGVEISAEEYNAIVDTIRNRPEATEGKGLRLTEALEWEEYDKPVVETDPEATVEDYQAVLADLGVEI